MSSPESAASVSPGNAAINTARAGVSTAETITFNRLVFAGALLLAVMVCVFWEFARVQVKWALDEPADWGHTLIIPFISGYFVWMRRAEINAHPLTPNWIGFPFVLVGVGAYIASTFGPSWFVLHHNARGAAMGVTLFGLALQICGWRVTKILLFPLAYWICFGQSISDRLLQLVTERMQDWSAIGAGAMLAIFQIDVERSGNVLSVYVDGEARKLNVAEACSGMRMLVAFLALGVAIAYTGLARNWQRAILILAGFPVALGVNILRVFTLGVLSLWNADFATGDFHSFIGLVWLVPALFFYLGILWFLSNMFVLVPEVKTVGVKSAAQQKGGADAN